jgi:YebC/PmpR family DNA-binding regulatory protein
LLFLIFKYMSGHSKWHNIQGKKGKADKARSGEFTKVSRLITVAARQGGGDPAMNFSLRLAVDKAKAVNMPKENIERSIKNGTGALGEGVILEELVYEGFGPGGAAVLVESFTDNRNRANTEIRNIFAKKGGNMGSGGSVQWMFKHMSVARVAQEQILKLSSRDDFDMAMIEAGAEDLVESEYGLEVRGPVPALQVILEKIKSFGLETEDAGLEWVAKETMSLSQEDSEKLQNLYDALEENDEVRAVYTNEG